MSTWKSAGGGVLAFIAILHPRASTIDDPLAQPSTTGQILFAVGTFLSVLVLHWLLWRYIVPVNSAAPPEVTSFIPPSSRQNVFSGATGFGYVNIALYCLD